MSELLGKRDAQMQRFFVVFSSDFRLPLGIILIPGASNLGSLFVKFCGGAPGSFLDAFWLPFGRLFRVF